MKEENGMQKFLSSILITILVAALFVAAPAFAKERPANRATAPQLAKPSIDDLETVNGNRIFNYLKNNGAWCSHQNPVGFGMQWPNQSGHSIDFASGLWIGGKVGNDIRSAASEFTSEWEGGHILPNGTQDDPGQAKDIHQVLKLNKADLLDEGFNNPDYGRWVNEAYQFGAPVLKAANGTDSLSATGKRIPALSGDQMLWMVYNDLDQGKHSALFGSSPLGLEVQSTVFVFNRPDVFGDMMFLKFLIVNKGGNTIDSTFIGIWFDIDLGDSNDDIVFCDTTLSLGAFWNDGADTDFEPPPAIGADFFQGPIVASPGDTALVSGRQVPGFKNLGMTSFAKYVRGGPVETQDPENALEAYNFMKGLNGLGGLVRDNTNQVTKFVNVSDPETGTGWIDGIDLAPADRRMLMNSGPFTLAPWTDTNGDGFAQVGEPGVQEVVVGVLIAQGTSAANSATALKRADASAQLAFDLNFALPPSPPVPNVAVSNQDGAVLLTWEGNAEDYEAEDKVDVDADGNSTFYTFQGYNIYQVNSPSVGPNSTVIKLATFDLADGIGDIKDFVFSSQFGEVVEATVQRAPDTGLSRLFRITGDALNAGTAVRNWQSFWFAVTAYGVNLQGIPKILESPLVPIEVVPQPLPGGVEGTADFGAFIAAVLPDTTFNATHTSSGTLSDGQLEVRVVDPGKVSGRDYRISFEDVSGSTVWHLDRQDPAGATRVLTNQTNQAGDESYNIVDGLQVKSIGPAKNYKLFLTVANAAGPINPPTQGAFPFNASGFPFIPEDPSIDRPAPNVGGASWGIHTGMTAALTSPAGSYDIFLGRTTRDGGNFDLLIPFDFELRFTAAGGKAWMAFTTGTVIDVPFEIWNIGIGTPDDPSDDFRMIPWVNDANGNEVFDLDGIDHIISGGDNDPETDWIYWINPTDQSPGQAGYLNEFVAAGAAYDGTGAGEDHHEVMARVILINFNGGSVSDPTFPANLGQQLPETGQIFRINTTKPNGPVDVFTFGTAGFDAVAAAGAADAAVDQLNVFPNPYFGQNRAEINPVNRFVTFTHLPTDQPVVIRIFTLAGELVKVIDDVDRATQGTVGTQTAQWDLRNDAGIAVASGIYLAHVSLGSLGERVRKVVVFMPQERLDKL